MLKPADPEAPRAFEFGDFRLDAQRRCLLKAGTPVALTPKVFDTLLYLVEHRGTVLGKDELLEALWPDVAVEENNLGQAISKLRQALGEAPGDNRFIVTIPGRGYRFAADVNVVTDEAEDADGLAILSTAPAPLAAPLNADGPRWTRRGLRGAGTAAALVLLVAATASYLGRSAGGPAALDPLPRSLAVLPFKALVPDNRDEALEFGMADSLIAKLGHIRELTVRPLAAVRRFHEPGQDPLEAGRALGVDAVLEGHIHRAENRVRVTVRLVRVADERQLWAGQFDEPLTSIFGIQDAISDRLTRELEVQLTPEESRRVAQRPTGDPAAYEAYLKGRFFISLAQPRQAIEMFEQAIRLDSSFAHAHAGLADILSRLPVATDGPSDEAMRRAKAAALTALELDPELGDASAALGWIAFYYDWDWTASERHYQRALAINPADFSARLGYAHLLSNTLRPDEALAEADLALAAEPLSPLAGTLRSQFLFHAGRYEEAEQHLRGVLANSPAFWIGQGLLGRIHLREGRFDEAIAAFEKAGGAGGVWTPLAMAGYAHGLAGRAASARRILEQLQEGRGSAAPPSLVAFVHLGLGEHSAALTWLERGHADKDVRMVFIGVDPAWAPLREDPRFAALLTRMGLGQ